MTVYFVHKLKKKIFHSMTILFLVMILPTYAKADVAFTTASGGLGVISKSGDGFEVSERTDGLGSETRIFGYNDGKRILVVEKRDTGDDRARIYDPANLSAPLVDTSWEKVSGIHDAIYLRGYLYLICHDTSNVVKINTNDHTKKEIEWIYPQRGLVPSLPAGYAARGVGITRFGDEIYALFGIHNEQGEYRDSILVNLADDIVTFRTLSHSILAPNASDLFVLGDRIYVTAFGGPEGVSADVTKSRLQRVDPESMAVTDIFAAGEVDPDGGLLAGLCFDDANRALVATRKTEGPDAGTRFWLLDGTRASTAKRVMTSAGTESTLQYDPVMRLLWVAAFADGGKGEIAAFENGVKKAAWDATALGGEPRRIAPVRDVSENSGDGDGDGSGNGTNGSSGGGGCTSGAWAWLFIAALFLKIKKTRTVL